MTGQSVSTVLARLRHPEYTGSNRCWPCTVVNAIALAVLAAGVSVVSIPAGMAVAGIGGVAIWLRGYLLPFTPLYAPILADRLPGDLFHQEPPSDSLASTAASEAEAVLAELVDAGVLRASGDTLDLDETFESEWYEEMERLDSVTDEALARELESRLFDEHDVSVHAKTDPPYIVVSDGTSSIANETWIRRPIATVEAAAGFTLQDWDVDPDVVTPAAHSLGLFLGTCPRCGTELQEQPASGCCGPPETGPNGNLVGEIVCESCAIRYHLSEQVT